MRIARIALLVGLIMSSGCVREDEGVPRAAVVSGLADMILAGGAPRESMCQAMALFGGREGLTSLYLSTSAPSDITDSLDNLGDAEREALAGHGVTPDDVRTAITDGTGKMTEEGAAIVADAIIAACGSE